MNESEERRPEAGRLEVSLVWTLSGLLSGLCGLESSRWLLLALWWLEGRGTKTPTHQEGAVSAPL